MAGIVGVGKIGRAHIEALRQIGCAEVGAIVVRDADRAARLADELGVPAFYTDYRDLLADPAVNVVHDCTPNLEHFRINRGAVLAGKAVLSEKPLTTDSRESAELVELAASHNVPTAVNFIYRQYPALRLLRKLISDGRLGRIYAIRGTYLQDWLLRETDYDWRVEAALGGASRAMADIGSHLCDLAQFLLKRNITEICADFGTFVPERCKPSDDGATSAPGETLGRIHVDTEDYAGFLARFQGGVHASFCVSQTSAGKKLGLGIEVDGSEASARWSQEKADKLLLGRRDEPTEELGVEPDSSGGTPGLRSRVQRDTIEAFYRTILFGDERRYADFADGHRIVRIVEAAQASARIGAWVRIE
jgi:predicted dehydrogenase